MKHQRIEFMTATTSSIAKQFARIAAVISLLFAALPAQAVKIVDINFDGGDAANFGAGPDGVLLGGAAVSGGQLMTDGSNEPDPTGAGLDLPLGELSPFGGDSDVSVSFDFSTTDDLAVLFSADGSHVTDPEADGQEGSLNIVIDGGFVFADYWFIGGFDAPGGPFNDGETHTVHYAYDAANLMGSLSVDGGEVGIFDFADFAEDFPDGPVRNSTQDKIRLGDENNFDAGVDWNDGCECTFDNLVIDAPGAPPVKLIVDRMTGDLSLEVISPEPVTIDTLQIVSGSGTIVDANYSGVSGVLDGNGTGTFDPDDLWQLESSSAEEVFESQTEGGADNGATLEPGETFELGSGVWQPFFNEDLRVVVNDVAVGEFPAGEVRGITEYVNGDALIFGDLDVDGDIDVDDFGLFRDGFGADLTDLTFFEAYFQADMNGDGTHNFEDWNEFAGAFDAENGEGAFAALHAVPEPAAIVLIGLGLGMLTLRRRSALSTGTLGVVAALCLFAPPTSTSAQVFVEYLFTSDLSDSSGNNRNGTANGPASVSGGQLELTGDFEEGVTFSLGANGPFDGLTPWTLEMEFNTDGNSFFPDSGVVLFGAYNSDDPANGDNQSLSVFIEPQFEEDGELLGGALVVDHYFVGDIRIEDTLLLDGQAHSIVATFEPSGNDDGEGVFFLNLDGEWRTIGEMAPIGPAAPINEGRIGGTLNEDFPYECVEGECFTIEYEGTVDNFRITTGDDILVPTLLRATADRESGEVTILGGEFAQELRYYEVNSESGALNPGNLNSLEAQGVDAVDGGDELGETWTVLNAAGGQIAEAFLLGSSVFDDSTNSNVSLGNIYNGASNSEDLEIIVSTVDGEDILLDVEYLGEAPTNPADLDDDGFVSQADLAIWEGGFSGGNGDGDVDGDGDSDGNDHLLIQRAWTGLPAGNASAAAVPEPTAAVLGLLAMTTFLSARRYM